MSNENYGSVDLPGVGEVRARPGTSTLELAGAAKHWHDKYQSVMRRKGSAFMGGVFSVVIIEAVILAVYFCLRS